MTLPTFASQSMATPSGILFVSSKADIRKECQGFLDFPPVYHPQVIGVLIQPTYLDSLTSIACQIDTSRRPCWQVRRLNTSPWKTRAPV